MQSLFRSTTRLARPSTSSLARTAYGIRPYAQQSYGGDNESGHPKSQEPNPKAHLEHPGPESPASSDKSSKDTSSTPKAQSQQSHSQGARPAISNPGPAPEQANEEVRKHNDEVAKSHDRPVNQLDEDGKVEKGFWSGKCFCSRSGVGRNDVRSLVVGCLASM